ncbi:MAG: CTP synthase [Nanoarchaeota archaeon]
MPAGYERGKTKFIITTGTVMSGLGKGIFSSSLAQLLQAKGLTVAPIKLEGYLNIDSGTLNPFRHGEVFVLDDGTECDMDLGTYERFLNLQLSKENFLTAGRLFSNILERERKGQYLGRDVQFVPHVTGEVKRVLRSLAMKNKADVVIVEIGGTVGDIENSYYLEAMRELNYEEGPGNVCFVTLTYILEPGFLGEQKSKAAQLGIKNLLSMGIQPHIIACRAENPVTEKVREKISIFSNVPIERVFSSHDVKSIYLLPLSLHEAKLDEAVLDILSLRDRVTNGEKHLKEWAGLADNILHPDRELVIGITGKYTWVRDSYASIIKALEHAGGKAKAKIRLKWIETTEIEKGTLTVEKAMEEISGIIVPGGFGKRGTEGKIACITYAREHNMPYLGLCFGFQMAVIEFARNVCSLGGANTTEVDTATPHPVIDILPEQKYIQSLGGNMRLGGRDVILRPGSKAWELYGKKETVRERFRHRYECNPAYIDSLEKQGMAFSGWAEGKQIMQVLELPKHPYFVGTQFHPEFTSRPLSSHPLFDGLVAAAMKYKG